MRKDHPRRELPSISTTRIALVVGTPLAVVFGMHAISWAAVALKTWTANERLTASDLNANFNAINGALVAPAAYKTVSSSGNVFVGTATRNADILTLSMTPTGGAGIVQLSAHGQVAFYYHTNSTSQLPDRWRCCLNASAMSACQDIDIAASWPTRGGGSQGTYALFTMSYPFPYSGAGSFNATLNCSVPTGGGGDDFAPPAAGSNYGYVNASAMTAVYAPAVAL